MKNFFWTFIAATLIYGSQSQDNICDGHFGQLIPHPDRCYAYIHCVLSSPQYYECPIGNIFVEDQKQCRPGNRQTCQVHILDEICRGIFWAARPYPGDETGKLFVGCIMEEGTLMSCFENEIFDLEINECILDQITSTTVTSTQTTSSPQDISTTTSFDVTSSTQEQTTTSSSETTGSTQETSTISSTQEPTTTSSSQEQTTTSSSETTSSTQETSTSTQEITTSSSQTITTTSFLSTAEPLNPCLGYPDGSFLPHEYDCTKYYFCLNRQPMPLTCPDGEIFSRESRYCVIGNPDEC